MAIADKILKLETDIDNAYTYISNKGGTVPQNKNTENLSNAIDSIPSGGGSHDWSAIGYSSEPQSIQDGYDYAVTVKNNWTGSSSYISWFKKDYHLIYMPLVDTSNGTSFSSMFQDCYALTTVPQIDTSSGTDFSNMFSGCESLTTVPQIDTSNGTSFSNMFYGCYALTTVPQIDTSNGTSFYYMFRNCASLTTIPQLNTSNGVNFGYVFYGCENLTTIPLLDFSSGTSFSYAFSSCKHLTNLGGFKNIGYAYLTTTSANNSAYSLILDSSNGVITHESLLNVINNLYDIATKGCNTQKLVLGNASLQRLTAEEIAVATNKGWTVS